MTTMENNKNTVYWLFSEFGIEGEIYKTVMGKKNFTLRHFENGK